MRTFLHRLFVKVPSLSNYYSLAATHIFLIYLIRFSKSFVSSSIFFWESCYYLFFAQCIFHIEMFDKDRSGTINIYEFRDLFNYINQWKATFESIDSDRSGFIEFAELTRCDHYLLIFLQAYQTLVLHVNKVSFWLDFYLCEYWSHLCIPCSEVRQWFLQFSRDVRRQ